MVIRQVKDAIRGIIYWDEDVKEPKKMFCCSTCKRANKIFYKFIEVGVFLQSQDYGFATVAESRTVYHF